MKVFMVCRHSNVLVMGCNIPSAYYDVVSVHSCRSAASKIVAGKNMTGRGDHRYTLKTKEVRDEE